MPDKFLNPPLVELIAEFQWNPAPAWVTEDSADPNADYEGFFTRMRDRWGARGFSLAERLLPRGVLAPPQQAVYRFTRPASEPPISYQLGPAAYSAHATPPYDSWETFRPLVLEGLSDLLAEWRQPDETARFHRVTLRYIDAFGDAYLRGGTQRDFIHSVLGFSLDVPTAIRDLLDPSHEPESFMQFNSTGSEGENFSVNIGQAFVNGERAVVMDLSLTTLGSTEASTDAAISALDRSHTKLHDTFIRLSEPFQQVMEPIS